MKIIESVLNVFIIKVRCPRPNELNKSFKKRILCSSPQAAQRIRAAYLDRRKVLDFYGRRARSEGRGATDLYISYNRNGACTKPTNLGDKINSPRSEYSPCISPDGRYFF